VHAEIDEKLAAWIERQHLFFVATAPLAADGHVNVSPKGDLRWFRILGPKEIAYLDFVGSGTEMAPTEGAGVVATPNWNELATANGTNVGLRDESGVYTGATVGWNSGGIWNLGLPNTPGDPRMMNGYLDPMAAAATITVSNLPENAGGYYVYVYADGDNASATRTGDYRLVGDDTTTTEIDITDAANTNFSGNFVLANNGVGNYAVFYTTSRGFTLTATPGASSDGTQRAPVNAIQIVRGDRIFADGFE